MVGATNGALQVPVVQAMAEHTWSQMGLAGGNISLKRKASRELDAHAGVGILNQVVATQKRKESHNATEQKRRQRINEKLKELQLLLPGSDPNADKASILNAAIDHIKRLQTESEQLAAKKHQLERANQVRNFVAMSCLVCLSFLLWLAHLFNPCLDCACDQSLRQPGLVVY
jgi:hypothetical protein